MDERARTVLLFLGSQLVFVVGLLHVVLGALNWLRWAQAGFLLPRDARWPAFVVSGLAVLAGLALARQATDRRPYYAAGVVAMVSYVVAYFGWHLGGHRLLLVVGPAAGGESPSLGWFLDHLFAGPVETFAVLAASLAAVVLLALVAAE